MLTEAVNNSILHGNQADPRKKVSVHAKVSEEHVAFTIKDEGKGFDPNKLPDPTTPDRIGQPSGRGVFIMKKLADYVDYSNKGRQLDLQFSVRSTRQV